MTLANEYLGAPRGRSRSMPPRSRGCAFPRICRQSVSGEMRENPRAEKEDHGDGGRAIHGTDEPDRAARASPPRGSENPATRTAFPHRRRLPYHPSNRDRRPAANACAPLAPVPNNSINIDKFTGFFDKLPKIFGTFYQSIFNGLWISGGRFPGDSGRKSFLGYVKFTRGISPPGAWRSRSAGCRSCPRPPAGGWSRGNSARRATP